MSALISAAELKKILGQKHVKVLDASYHLPPSAQGIPGARDFDIDDVADTQAPFAHTVPSPQLFAEKTGALGIGNDDLVVVYDRSGIYMAASRAWWMFRLFGHENVKILDGGLPAWIKTGYATEEKSSIAPPPAVFKAAFKSHLLKQLEQIKGNIAAKNFTLLDARDAGRFTGETPDPRPQVESGHIPDSLSTPFMQFINPDGTLKTKDELEKALQNARVSLQDKLACSCGSGVTACVVALALYELGRKDAAVYDGSWTEWGSNPALPKAKGP
ncbi:MAG: sulfurtransferase [Alphaproteobacteria bacterium]|nr:sulfurtransferase [Alphaproteobacteria bacterium]